MANQCPVCGSESRRFIDGNVDVGKFFRESESYVIAGGAKEARLPVEVCGRCGHGFTPLLGVREEEIVAWYRRNEADESFVADERARRKTAAVVLSRMETYGRRGRLLDVGAGPGLFLAEAAERGWEVAGVEPSKWSVMYAREHYGIDMRLDGFGALTEFEKESFEAVTIFDVIEHVAEPVQLVAALARVLKPEGLLVLTTPRFDSLMARVSGQWWHAIFPAHIHYFTRRSLYRVLKRGGFEVVADRHHTRYLGWLYVWRRLMAYVDRRAMKSVCQSSAMIPVNIGDEFEVYARKQ